MCGVAVRHLQQNKVQYSIAHSIEWSHPCCTAVPLARSAKVKLMEGLAIKAKKTMHLQQLRWKPRRQAGLGCPAACTGLCTANEFIHLQLCKKLLQGVQVRWWAFTIRHRPTGTCMDKMHDDLDLVRPDFFEGCCRKCCGSIGYLNGVDWCSC